MNRFKRKHPHLFLSLLLVLILVAVGWYLWYEYGDDWVLPNRALHYAVTAADTSEDLIYDVKTTFGTTDQGQFVYEISFSDYTTGYRYVVDARTGQILEQTVTKGGEDQS